MIIARLSGGLGNQLFQYAAGRALAERLGAELRVDASWYGEVAARAYALPRLGVDVGTASADDVRRLRRWKTSLLDRVATKVKSGGLPAPRSYFREPHFHYAPEFDALSDDTYLDGYWQSPRYFAPIASVIRRSVNWPEPPDERARRIEERIAKVQSVSLHVRRGDYVSNRAIADLYAKCGPEYYERAIRAAREVLSDPVFFLFTDDPEWARMNWSRSVPCEVVSGLHDGGPEQDLRLMSRCQHHIIANSTFSWWAAWLNPSPGKNVFAPGAWFARRGYDERDLLPPEWKRLAVEAEGAVGS